MKGRYNYKPNEKGYWTFSICNEYPVCDCDGHYVWEENKKSKDEK